MASLCYEGRYTISFTGEPPPPIIWPAEATCRPVEGLCYTSATVVMDRTTVQAGCWPPLTPGQLAYSGDQVGSSCNVCFNMPEILYCPLQVVFRIRQLFKQIRILGSVSFLCGSVSESGSESESYSSFSIC